MYFNYVPKPVRCKGEIHISWTYTRFHKAQTAGLLILYQKPFLVARKKQNEGHWWSHQEPCYYHIQKSSCFRELPSFESADENHLTRDRLLPGSMVRANEGVYQCDGAQCHKPCSSPHQAVPVSSWDQGHLRQLLYLVLVLPLCTVHFYCMPCLTPLLL